MDPTSLRSPMRARGLAILLVALLALPALAPAGASGGPAWGDVATAKLRPGASLGGYCTINFAFTDASNDVYFGTAAHCTDEVGERVSTSGVGTWGTVVYDSDETAGANADVDFSLIKVDAGKVGDANPAMLGWNGPTGVATGTDLAFGRSVAFYGYGVGFGSVASLRAREGVLVSHTATTYKSDMPAVNGDSGAPIVDKETGRAVGIVSAYGIYTLPPTTDNGPLMTFILDELDDAGFDVDLATA